MIYGKQMGGPNTSPSTFYPVTIGLQVNISSPAIKLLLLAPFQRTSDVPAGFPAIFSLSVCLPESERLTLGRLESGATDSNTTTVQQAAETLAHCVNLKEHEATTDGKV